MFVLNLLLFYPTLIPTNHIHFYVYKHEIFLFLFYLNLRFVSSHSPFLDKISTDAHI